MATDQRTTGTEDYYRERALEYDRVYRKPERQPELRVLEDWLAEMLAGHNVLEVAAGTGYWTQFFAPRATSVVATDINTAVLDVARQRRAWEPNVSFVKASAFDLGALGGPFDGAFAGFFWSHLLKDQLAQCLSHLADHLRPGGRLVFMDNRFVPGSSTPISRTDEAGNTYQTRPLSDGTTWEVLKNFPSAEELRDHLGPLGGTCTVTDHQYFWTATVDL